MQHHSLGRNLVFLHLVHQLSLITVQFNHFRSVECIICDTVFLLIILQMSPSIQVPAST
jgi:hypothetical protein